MSSYLNEVNTVLQEAKDLWSDMVLEIMSSFDKDDIISRLEADPLPVLDNDPLIYGPKRLNNKVSQASACLQNTTNWHMSVSNNCRVLQRQIRAEQLAFDMAYKKLLTSDPDVKNRRSDKEREAVAIMKLQTDYTKLQKIQAMYMDMESLNALIKARISHIKDVLGLLRQQQKLCEHELSMPGVKWGRESAPYGVAADKDLTDLDRFIDIKEPIIGSEKELKFDQPLEDDELDLILNLGSDNQTVEAPVKVEVEIKPSPSEVLKPTATSEDIKSALERFDVKPPSKTSKKEDNLDDLLDLFEL